MAARLGNYGLCVGFYTSDSFLSHMIAGLSRFSPRLVCVIRQISNSDTMVLQLCRCDCDILCLGRCDNSLRSQRFDSNQRHSI